MPINHRVHFTKKCSDDPAARLRTPGCAVREKQFEPHSRTSHAHVNVRSREKKTDNLIENDIQTENENVIQTENEI